MFKDWNLPSQRKEKKVAAINKVRELIEVGITVPEYNLSHTTLPERTMSWQMLFCKPFM